MAVNLSPVGGVAGQFFDNNGVPLSGGKIYTYSAGTTTNQATYTNASGTVAHANPIVLDSGGRVPSGEIWLTDGLQYKFVLKTSADVLIGTYDNIIGINSNFVNFVTEEEIQTATAGQTVFTLGTMQYQPGTNNLTVYVDGVNQYDGSSYSYVETSSTVVTFTAGLHVGALVKFTTAQTLSTGVTDSSLVTYEPPFTNSATTTVENKLAQTVSVKDFGAVGDGIADDTAAIQAAHSASAQVYYPQGVYKINWPESTAMVAYTSTDRISIIGDGAKLYDTRVYAADSVSAVFQLTSCTNVVIEGLDYEGQPIVNKSNPTTGIGYRGATFVNLSTGCENITVTANLNYLRYGMRGGDYTLYATGENNNLKAVLTTLECGYPVALYLSTGVDFLIYAEGSHRAAYLAGVQQGKVRAYFKNQYIAPIQVLLTDATTNNQTYPTGTSRGCAGLDIVAHDIGSTIWVDNSFCAGISMSRGDAGTTYENLNFDVYVKSTDTVASKLSAFGLYNSFTPYQPSYPNEWQQTFYFKNIKVTGTLDRSAQTTAENSGNGEIYIYTYTSGTNYGTIQGLDITGFRYYPGSGAKTRGFYYVAPGLTGQSSISSCDFGTDTPFLLRTNATSLVSFNASQLRGSYSGTSDSPFNSAAAFTDCVIADPAYQPFTNKNFYNTAVKSAKAGLVTRIIDAVALSGASVTIIGAFPAGSVVVGVSGIVTTAITGATGFEVGTAVTSTLYANKSAVAQGTLITAVTDSSATAPINYPSSTNLVITAKTSNFTGGAIRLAVQYINFTSLAL